MAKPAKSPPSNGQKVWGVVIAVLMVLSISAKLWRAYNPKPDPAQDPRYQEIMEAQRQLEELKRMGVLKDE